MAHSQGCWQEALLSCHSDLSIGLLEFPHIIEACFPQDRQSFCNLALKSPTIFSAVSCRLHRPICSVWMGTTQGMEGRIVGGQPGDWLQHHLVLGEESDTHLPHPLEASPMAGMGRKACFLLWITKM